MSTDLTSQIKKFIRLTKLAQAIQHSEASWQTKFELIFSDEVIGKINETNFKLSYFDTQDYDIGVKTFVEMLSKKAEELEKVLISIQSSIGEREKGNLNAQD